MGIRPWEIALLTVAQFDRACAAVDQINQNVNSEPDG